MVEFFDFKETEGFVSKKTVIDERLDGMDNANEKQSEEIAENKRVNDKQDQAIAENKELDEKQGQDIESNKELIDANDEADKVRDEKIASIKLEKVDELTYEFTNAEGDVTTINIPKDIFLKDASYDAEKKEITLVVVTADGDKTLTIDMSELVDVYVVADDSTEYMTINADNEISIKKVIETLDELNDAATENATAIENEVTRAQSAESELSEALETEVARAQEAESGLSEAIESAKTELSDVVKAEETRALEVESALTDTIESAKTELSDAIKAEETRAEGVESEIKKSIEQNEDAIALLNDDATVEGSVKFTVNASIAKVVDDAPEAFDTLKEIADWISDHSSTAIEMQNQINSNTNDIETEVVRAQEAESGLTEAINSEVTRAQDVETTLSEALESAKTELSSAIEGVESALTDAMAEVAETYQVKGDYATKAEVETEASRAQEVESGLTDSINAEKERALSAESELSDSINEVESALTDAMAEVAETYQVKGDYASVATVQAMAAQISQLMTRVEMLESLQTNLVVASDASAVASIAPELAASTALVLNSKDAIEVMTANTTFESIAIVGGTNDKTIKLMATDKVIVDSLEVKGDAGNINGKINYTTPKLEVKNLTVDNESSAYNLFEGSQKPTDESTLNKVVTVTNANINAPSLTHNVINVYTPANDAVITIADSYFNVNAEKTNIVRISNTSNATGVSIVFDNVVLSYEDGGADRGYAGLMFYQAYGADKSYSGDTSAIATWSLKFKDCYYVTADGSKEKITALNYGQDNQVTYAYGINKGGKTDLSEIISDITFE